MPNPLFAELTGSQRRQVRYLFGKVDCQTFAFSVSCQCDEGIWRQAAGVIEAVGYIYAHAGHSTGLASTRGASEQTRVA